MCAYYTESQVASPEGLSLFVRCWQPEKIRCKAHLLIVPGYAEHGGRYRELAHHFAHRGIAVSAVDLRGHGRSEGRRGYVRRFDNYLDDIQAALETVPETSRVLLGHSNGGLAALDFVVTRRPGLAGMIVTNPFLGLATPLTGLKLRVMTLAGMHRPTLSLPSGLHPAGLTRDPHVVDAYRRDPLVFRTANAGWFREVTAAQKRVRAFRRVEMPLLYVYSDSDPVASPKLNRTLAEQLHSQDKTIMRRDGELHEVLNEVDRTSLHDRIADWILDRTASRKRRGHAAPRSNKDGAEI